MSSKIPEPYLRIVNENYVLFDRNSEIDDRALAKYFNGCFDDVIKFYGLYQAWVCPECLHRGDRSFGFDIKPGKCQFCGRPVYDIAIFQARGKYTGLVFKYAVLNLLRKKFELDFRMPEKQSRYYNLEIGKETVVLTRGSPLNIIRPDGGRTTLTRAGMKRSDTIDKAKTRAEEWKRKMPNSEIYIVTNSLPNGISYSKKSISGIFDLSKKGQLVEFVDELR